MESLSFKNDKRISLQVRARLRKFCATLDDDIAELANDLGVRLFSEDLFPYESGYLEYDPTCGSTSGFKIVINSNHQLERQRFTVAHEIAHFLLHKEDARKRKSHRKDGYVYDPFVYLMPQDKNKESEANAFAAHLLMPQNLFEPAFKRLDGDVQKLARLFLVSPDAARRRVHEIQHLRRE